MSGRNSEPGRSVVSKAFAILEALHAAQTGLTRAQLSRRTGLPPTTVHRLAGELRSLGALEAVDGGYRIGAWLWELGTLTSRRASLRELAVPFMEDLYEATHENVQLAVLDGFDALYIERIRGRRSVPIVTRVGGRLPLHATGVGKALLAFTQPAFIDEVIARGLPALTPHTITDPTRLRANLAEVRRHGYAVTRDEMTMSTVSVAAPLFGPDDRVVGALSLVVNARGADVARLSRPVRVAAMGLSRRITERWDQESAHAWVRLPREGAARG